MNSESTAGKGQENMPEFFYDAEFQIKYPGVKVPPPCYLASGAKIIAYVPNKSLTVAFPVREDQTNPVGSLQGGILGSFFDDTFGPLSFKTMRKPCVSIDITVNFIRPVRPGETVVIMAEFKSKGKKLVQMYGEAHNDKNKLIATATSNLMVYEP
ncbi:MAG TPA: PaaI family thioesterase [Nitrospirota bacterium]|nr:PaaI family thioesterase [Nitrospirota bacterium]